MTTGIRFEVHCRTSASNARGHSRFTGAATTKRERKALRARWGELVVPLQWPGLLVPAQVLRLPLGTSMKARKAAKALGVDLRKLEPVLKPVAPLVVTMTRISAGLLDDDNLGPALKAMRDEIARGMGVDDRDPLIRWVRLQERGPKGSGSVRVEIERRDDRPPDHTAFDTTANQALRFVEGEPGPGEFSVEAKNCTFRFHPSAIGHAMVLHYPAGQQRIRWGENGATP